MTTPLFTDRYSDSRPPGQVIGCPAPCGARRGGTDVERVIGIDNDALRIQPLREPGWGRAGLVYGPFHRQNGLAFVTSLLNGHNTSQNGHLTQSFARRLYRWARGDGSVLLPARLLDWRHYPAPRRTFSQFRRWWLIHRRSAQGTLARLDDNLAVGWFFTDVPAHPSEANAFVMRATGGENGQLCCRVDDAWLPALDGVQNIPLLLVVILREKGAAYYAASIPEAADLPAPPELRPLAIDSLADNRRAYASIHQSVLGQIGFHVDSRVFGTQVVSHPSWLDWYGTAHAADSLRGAGGALDSAPAQVGGAWSTGGSLWMRTTTGTLAGEREGLAYLMPGEASGLVHVLFEPAADRDACLVWRLRDQQNCWSLWLGTPGSRLRLRQAGVWMDVARDAAAIPALGKLHSVQILDSGRTFSLYLDGSRLFGSSFADTRLHSASGVGFYLPAGQGSPIFCRLEAHPRTITLPGIEMLAPPAPPAPGSVVACQDQFEGTRSELWNGVWRREFGRGTFVRTGAGGVRVQASTQEPNPGRTFYTIRWEQPDFADLEVEVTPPGTRRGQGERGRGGFVFWQDKRNYIIVSNWLDDCYEGASISSFFHLNGFEELYDAVWTNVGSRIRWGVPYRLRVRFDGLRYIAQVNGEPVLYRALTDVYPDTPRLHINRVGLAANWEWGNDTGTIFRDFIAKTG